MSAAAMWMVVAVVLALATLPADGQPTRTDLLRQANLVFTGTVQQVGDVAPLSGVARSPRMIVVRVDAIVDKPRAVTLALGDPVTVETKDPAPFRPGVQATFYTELWVLGKRIAVREVGHEIVRATAGVSDAEARARLHREVATGREAVRTAELRRRVQTADAVVVGVVRTVRPAPQAAIAARPNVKISEHNPDWHEAVVEVESWIKGAQPTANVVVRFPASRDVSWVQYPKFRVGQEGTFLLQTDKVSGAPARAEASGRPVSAFSAVARQDILPKSDATRVRGLVTP